MTDEAQGESLDELFEEETPEVTEETSQVEETTTETVEEAEPTSEKEEAKLVPVAALQDERHKRQQLESRLQELEKQLPKSEEAPDPITEPEEYESYIRNKVEKEYEDRAAAEYKEKVEASRSQMLEAETDYIELEKVFMLMTVTDDTLATQMNASADPARFAYDTAKAYRDSLLAPQTPETIQDVVAQVDPVKPVPSLARATAGASNSIPVVEDEESMDEMFADQSY